MNTIDPTRDVHPTDGDTRIEAPTVDPAPTSSNDDEPARAWVVAAVLATAVLLGAIAWTIARPDRAVAPPASATADPTATSHVPTSPSVVVPEVQPVDTLTPVEVVPTPIDTDIAEADPVAVPPAAPEPPTTQPPVETVPPPVAAPELVAQTTYELDPGVHGVSISIANQGDAPLSFSIANDGDGFAADTPSGSIDVGGQASIWIDLDLPVAGEGPTPFERVVEVTSDGGDASITVTGQIEKPGFLVVEAPSVPLVEFRATVRFTNVGGLPLEIAEIVAPGLTLSPVPDEIGPGETLEIDVAMCANDPLPPGYVVVPNPAQPLQQLYQVTTHVVVVTDVNADQAVLQSTTAHFDRPSCQPDVELPEPVISLGG